MEQLIGKVKPKKEPGRTQTHRVFRNNGVKEQGVVSHWRLVLIWLFTITAL